MNKGCLDLTLVGLVLVLVGFGVVIIASFLTTGGRAKDDQQGRVKGAGVVMIGPIPVIFGSDAKWVSIAIVLAILLIIVSLIAMVFRA